MKCGTFKNLLRNMLPYAVATLSSYYDIDEEIESNEYDSLSDNEKSAIDLVKKSKYIQKCMPMHPD